MLMPDDALAKELALSPKMVTEARRHWQRFVSEDQVDIRAAECYSGMVFRKLAAGKFSEDVWLYAQERLLICSFVYGILRPADGIRPYRMEGAVRLDSGQSVFSYWRDLLTPYLIECVRRAGGVLVFLASEEMKQLFHWAQVEAAVTVIYPTLLTRLPNGHLKQIVVYTKMARGAMARAILSERLSDPQALKSMTPEGFIYSHESDSTNEWIYILG